MNCTTTDCNAKATKIMAWPMLVNRAQYVAPYCNEHAKEMREFFGAVPACGPALSKEAAKIEGIR